ncbi:MAG: molybdopterin molybdotransferase MoeA, partial [Candidatus Electryoneaceae bacterium]|nr:molybdopterin molybdotransferase MoeA [Candidatus Electryoneaceae bacterium]
MISLQEAGELIDHSVTPLSSLMTPISDGVHCKLIDDLYSPINVPGFASSAMDGIAILYDDLIGVGPWRLKIQDTVAAGDAPTTLLRKECCVKIMTGAPLPNNADTIIPVEKLTFHDKVVEITDRPKLGTFVRPVGDSLKENDLIFQRGYRLKPVDIGVLASIGLERIHVIPKPSIAVISTGSEIISPGSPLGPGQIYNSNDTTLSALLINAGFRSVSILPPTTDDVETLRRRFDEALTSHHVLITTGGVSMGDFDFIPHVVKELGGEIVFHKVRIKPGKPILLAKFDRNGQRWLIGL